jgi:CHAT domain-containing protein/tetratricopeptide (TPR) repeat protein
VGDLPGQAGSLLNLGMAYDYLDENQKAIDYYEQALPLYRSLGIRLKEGATLNNLSDLYMELGEPEKALGYLERALALFRSMHYSGDGVAMTLYNIGSAYRRMGQSQKALDYYNQSLANAREQNLFRVITAAMYGIGTTHNNLGRHHEAVEYFKQALSSYQTAGDRGGQALTLNAIGKAHLDAGEPEKALDFLNRALALWRDIGGRDGEAAALYQLARCSRNRGDLNAARAQVEASLEIVESLRTKLTGQELRASYLASVQDYYEFYIDLLMRLHAQRPYDGHDAEALHISERARARSLLELLAEASADIRQGVDPVLLERERTLQRLLNAKAESQTRLLSGTHTKEQAADAAKEIEETATEYRQVRAQIRIKSPRYAALTQPQPLSLKEIQTEVHQDTLLLEFALGEERSFLWAVTPTSLTGFELPKRAEIEVAARRVYELLTARNRRSDGETAEQWRARVAQADNAYPAAAAVLSQMLLGRAAPLLGEKRLLVVCDGVLQFVPFAALPTPSGPVDARTGARPPLIAEHEIISLPSASTLAVLRRELAGREPAPKTVAVLADPVFDKDDERVLANNAGKRASRPSGGAAEPAFLREVVRAMEDVNDSSQRLPRLYNTRAEAEVIRSLVPPRESLQALDFAANRATATSASLSQYRILHFATHAIIDSTHPELSGIVLSLVNEQGEPQDGFLRAHEIFNLKLPAELVVLSACRTGLGKEVKGEGLVGMTRGFMYAGAPRVVVSLWSLDDRATAELMARFYRKMLRAERLAPAAALRSAQVEMWRSKRWGQPYFWAAAVLQGEWK